MIDPEHENKLTQEPLKNSVKQEKIDSLFQTAQAPLWIRPSIDTKMVSALGKELHFDPILTETLVGRGYSTKEAIYKHLYAKLPDLHDPFLFPEMPNAVLRIFQALHKEEKILIYGDNDVDGMTGTALLAEFITYLGGKVLFYISNRAAILRQSLILDALEFALKNECSLLITVDCGITAAEQIEEVLKHNVDVIITDHHEPTARIPNCVATLNPKLVSSPYPNRELTGVGVAFKLAHALTEHALQEGWNPGKKIDLKRYLDLVAIGTVADMGALVGENRILVSYGIEQLRKTKRIGLAKLLAICETDIDDSTSAIISSKIAPRLNSLGRIAEPLDGVRLLLVRNTLAAEKLASELNLYNIERQKIEKLMSKDIFRSLEHHPELLERKAIIMSSKKWHPGIIAILAMRLSKFYNRPSVLIALEGQIGKGSIRSIPEFPVLSVLKELSSLLLNYGGHDSAAGFIIKEQNIPEFSLRFCEIADRRLQEVHIYPKLCIDADVPFNALTFELMESLTLLEPYGYGNLPPTFSTRAKQASEPRVIRRQHLKLFLEQEDRILEGVALGQAHRYKEFVSWKGEIDVAYTPQVSQSAIQLIIRDLKLVAPHG